MMTNASAYVHPDSDVCDGGPDHESETLHIVCPHPKGAFVMRLCRECVRKVLPDMEKFAQ